MTVVTSRPRPAPVGLAPGPDRWRTEPRGRATERVISVTFHYGSTPTARAGWRPASLVRIGHHPVPGRHGPIRFALDDVRCPFTPGPVTSGVRQRHAVRLICPAQPAPDTVPRSGSRTGHVGSGIVPERSCGLPTHAGAARPRTAPHVKHGSRRAGLGAPPLPTRRPDGPPRPHGCATRRAVRGQPPSPGAPVRVPARPDHAGRRRRRRGRRRRPDGGLRAASGTGGLEPVSTTAVVPVTNLATTRRTSGPASRWKPSAATSCCRTRPHWPWTRPLRWT